MTGTRHDTVTLVDACRAIRERRVSPVELVTEAIRSLQDWQPVTNATSQLFASEALRAAAALPAQPIGPLHGVPVLVKELFDVAGHETTGCCEAFHGNIASSDAFVVQRLREAGAIIVGKANMHELAASGTNHISACGPTRNPWAPDRLTGGSSGGSAAAVATRSVPFTLGTDTAGSIRVPSSFCGTTGLKPTHGRLPMAGTMPLSPRMGCIGPMAGSVEDVALGYAALANEPNQLAATAGSLRGLRVGHIREGYFATLVHPAVRGALDDAAEILVAAGATLVEASLPGIDGALHTWGNIAWPEFAVAYPDLDLDRVGQQIAGHYRYGQDLSATDRSLALEHATRMHAAFVAALHDLDALLLPVTAYPAPRFADEEIAVGDGQTLNVFRGGPVWFTCPVDIAMVPALSLPSGFDPEGLPLGLQLVGRFAEEWTLLRIGHAYQALTTHHLRARAAVVHDDGGSGLMARPEIVCRAASGADDAAMHHRIRHEVFVLEQAVFATSDADLHDAVDDTVKVLGWVASPGGGWEAGGAVRLYPLEPGIWQGDRLAVLAPFRAWNLGGHLVRYAVATAAHLGAVEMVAHVQTGNVRFFERLGWLRRGEPEVYVGRPHQPMAIDLTVPAVRGRGARSRGTSRMPLLPRDG